MKTRILLITLLALQLVFLFFIAMLAPESEGGIKVGLERLKESDSSQAMTIKNFNTNVLTLNTAGDQFYAAGETIRVTDRATMIFLILSSIISVLALIALKKQASDKLNS